VRAVVRTIARLLRCRVRVFVPYRLWVLRRGRMFLLTLRFVAIGRMLRAPVTVMAIRVAVRGLRLA
jgi:hypothetical protein